MPVHDLSGATINDRYRIVSCIGVGGMGTVYEAEHIEDRRRVALKVLLPGTCARKTDLERFFREAKAASAIQHEGIVEILDVDTTPRGVAFYVMELLHGEDLAVTLRREGCLPWARVRQIGLQLCGVLAAVHDKGIIHRDLKPANLFVVKSPSGEQIKLLDFGIAKLVGADELSYATLTATGEVLGTAAYMSPEQASGQPIDHRTDIYTTGVILYQLLTGVLPFVGNTPQQIIRAILAGEPPSMHTLDPDADIPHEAELVIGCCLQPAPSQRFGSAQALANALTAVSDAPGHGHHETLPHPEVTVVSNVRSSSAAVSGILDDDMDSLDTGVRPQQPEETNPTGPGDSRISDSPRASSMTTWLIVLASLVTLLCLAAWIYFLETTPGTLRGRS